MINLEFEVPKQTTEKEPYTQVFDLGINAKYIKNIIVTIPKGHKGLAFLQIRTPGSMLVPQAGSSSVFVRGEETESTFNVNKRVDGPPYNIICVGYNLDEYYPHAFLINVEI